MGVEIVTLGQYLRPTAAHLPVARWWTPAEFEELADDGAGAWASPTSRRPHLTRSSYHAKRAVAASGLAGAVAETADVQ